MPQPSNTILLEALNELGTSMDALRKENSEDHKKILASYKTSYKPRVSTFDSIVAGLIGVAIVLFLVTFHVLYI